jgi:hypothetical protein
MNPIFFVKGHVVMGTQASSVYQQVMEKTKGLLFKCQVLEQNYEKKKKTGTNDNYTAAKVRKLMCCGKTCKSFK